MGNWQVQEAKARLSELIDRATTEGPQTITRHGKPSAVVVSVMDFEAMKASKPKPDFADYLLNYGPKFDDPDALFDFSRSKDTGRDIDLD